MKKVLMLWVALALLCASSVSFAAAQEDKPVFASESCRAGCYAVNNLGTMIYTGLAPKSYRVCSGDGFSAELEVDGRAVHLDSNSYGVRSCLDVNGQAIKLLAGTVLVGILP